MNNDELALMGSSWVCFDHKGIQRVHTSIQLICIDTDPTIPAMADIHDLNDEVRLDDN